MKSKEKSKIEYYKGIIRKLKADNSRLRKLLSRYEDGHNQESDEGSEDKEYSVYKKDSSCPNCEDGEITSTEVVGRLITRCAECGYRKVEKIDG